MSAYQWLHYSTGPGGTRSLGKLRVTGANNGLDDTQQVVVVLSLIGQRLRSIL